MDHGREEDNTKEQLTQQQLQQPSHESVAVNLSSKDTDTTPLIREADGEAFDQNQTMGTEQVKNVPEGKNIGVNPYC